LTALDVSGALTIINQNLLKKVLENLKEINPNDDEDNKIGLAKAWVTFY
jgi:hypothetical protein